MKQSFANRFKWFARLAALVMVLPLLASGCKGSAAPQATNAPVAQASQVPAADPAAPAATDGFDENGYWTGEVVKLTMLTAAGGGYIMNDRRETRVHQELLKKTGVDMVWEDATSDKFNMLMASGDLPDMVQTGITIDKDKEALFKSGQVLPLSDLIEKYAPDMVRDLAVPLEITRKSLGLGDGEIYQIPIMIGEVEREDYPLYIRWDWYKEIGAPEFTTWREYLDILKQIVERHPTTDDGKKVFGLGGWVNWGVGWWTFAPNMGSLPGWGGFGPSSASYVNYGDNSMIMAWDERNPEFMQVEVANIASRLGIYDPDTMIQSNEDFNAKRNAGQYVSLFGTWVIRQFNSDHAAEGIGYVPAIPTGGNYYVAGHQKNDAGALSIIVSKNCKDPAAAMRWLNYVCSYEGNEMLYNGVEGIDWVINDSGKPELTEKFIADREAGVGGDVTGIGFNNFYSAFQRTAIDPNLGMPTRWIEDPVVSSQIRTALEKDYCDYYNVLSVNDRFEKAFESGDIKSMRDWNVTASVFALLPPTDIARTASELGDLKVQWWNKMYLAKDDAELEALKQAAIEDYKKLDLAALEAFCKESWETAQAATVID
ncbi:MAG: extracellular solute-binding protein [Clostridiales bacterium]|nr:extracellular solute-binding protein [Clostridiales bacterium]